MDSLSCPAFDYSFKQNGGSLGQCGVQDNFNSNPLVKDAPEIALSIYKIVAYAIISYGVLFFCFYRLLICFDRRRFKKRFGKTTVNDKSYYQQALNSQNEKEELEDNLILDSRLHEEVDIGQNEEEKLEDGLESRLHEEGDIGQGDNNDFNNIKKDKVGAYSVVENDIENVHLTLSKVQEDSEDQKLLTETTSKVDNSESF